MIGVLIPAVVIGIILSLAPILPFFTRGVELSEVQSIREYVAHNEIEYHAENTLPSFPILVIVLDGCAIGALTFYVMKRHLLSTKRLLQGK